MPWDRSRYPPDWPAISKRIRERDGNACKNCGAPNGQEIMRAPNSTAWRLVDQIRGSDIGYLEERGGRIVKIVLTVHHLPEAESTMDCRDEVLVSVCQACHFSMDRAGNIAKSKETRNRKRQEKVKEKGQIVLEMV
jgi:hypothetical protein